MGEWGQDSPRRGGPAQQALWNLLQLLSHQPSAGPEGTVSRVVTRKFLPSLGLLVASDAIGDSDLCVVCVCVCVRMCGSGLGGKRLWVSRPSLHVPSSVQL